MKARAKRIDNGDYLEGHYFKNMLEEHYIDSTSIKGGVNFEKVDPSTIEYKVGDEWLTEDEIVRRCTIDNGVSNSELTKSERIDYIESLNLQNTSGRESAIEMFRLGIEAALEEMERRPLNQSNRPDEGDNDQ